MTAWCFLPLPMAQIFFQKPDAVTGFEVSVSRTPNIWKALCRNSAVS